MTAAQRARNQERFIRDDIRVICATIAFGMGIDKPNVRYVVHYDVPKSIEGYYQETGRAGRDGLPSECALFFNGGDAAKQRHFIRQLSDDTVREQAERLLHSMLELASTPHCRRAHMLRYFGDERVSGECGNCDNCLQPPERIDGTIAAHKALSCVYRICSAGFATGEQHVIDVLLGRATEKVQSWRHDRLSTFGVGTEHDRAAWRSFISELLRSGELEKDTEHRTLTLTRQGLDALRDRRAFTFFKPRAVERKRKNGRASATLAPGSEDLFQRLRAVRKELADEQAVPPYVIFSDATLRELAERKPSTLSAFRAIGGVGDVKLERYGRIFLDAIAAHSM
jgi:ATP-dependent DNA helicase RecQ